MKPAGQQAYEQGDLPDDDPDVVAGMAELGVHRLLDAIEDAG